MSTPCYNEIKLGEYLLRELQEDRLEEAAEKLQEEWYEEVGQAAQANQLLAEFVDSFSDQLGDFLMDRAKEQLMN